MKFRLLFVFFITLLLTSCNEEAQRRLEAQKKEAEKAKVIFAALEKGWKFQSQPINEVAEKSMGFWPQWRTFMDELAQKPKSSISAFQKKTRMLTKKAEELKNSIPGQYNNAAIRSRISIVITNVSLLDMYMHLTQIPDKKVVRQIGEINQELIALQRELDKIDMKSKIPIEQGEIEMLQMMKDTARAIPSTVLLPSNTPKVE